jgi:two-component system KDP operon response regulator KdpE
MKRSECVLIVDGDSGVRNHLNNILKANDYFVLTANSEAQAISMITTNCPDIVLLDPALPDADGLKLLKCA